MTDFLLLYEFRLFSPLKSITRSLFLKRLSAASVSEVKEIESYDKLFMNCLSLEREEYVQHKAFAVPLAKANILLGNYRPIRETATTNGMLFRQAVGLIE
jgi:hypothetical protein